ncbi:DNA/RNA nuclease SfsA [Eubacteriales bacterium KG127]
MRYENIVKGKFISRPNRFVAYVEIEDKSQKVHVKNTGRCSEILKPNATVFLEDFRNRMGSRKLPFSLISVIKETPAGNLHINIDSQAPNKVVKEALGAKKIILPGLDDLSLIKPEKQYADSRFDFYLEDVSGRKAFVEIKGVTLEKSGLAMFPDAPTVRGSKHLSHLVSATNEGYLCFVIFVIQMKNILEFTPHKVQDPLFYENILKAKESGVTILAFDSIVSENQLIIDAPVPVNI